MAPPINYRQVAAAAARKYGVPVNLFLSQIQRESGFRPDARSGAGAVGIAQIVPKWHPGVDATNPVQSLDYAARYMAGLHNKYGGWAPALSVYNSGNPNAFKDPNFAGGQTYNYVRAILGNGRPPNDTAPPSFGGSPGLTPKMPSGVPGAQLHYNIAPLLKLLQAEGGLATYQHLRSIMPVAPPPTATVPAPNAPRFPGAPVGAGLPPTPAQHGAWPSIRKGVPVAKLTSIGGVHQTEGLPGFPARDYFAKAGTEVAAPVSGTVIRLSGHDPRLGPIQGPHGPLGWSVYIQGSDGHIYYLTHMGSRQVKVGEQLKAGQPIGTVANYAKYGTPSHIHMGVH